MILQDENNRLVLIDCAVDLTTNIITAKMTYAESGLVSPVLVKSTTGDNFELLLEPEILDLSTYAVDVADRVFELV